MRKLDRQMDGRGAFAISPVPGPTAPAGDNKWLYLKLAYYILKIGKLWIIHAVIYRNKLDFKEAF